MMLRRFCIAMVLVTLAVTLAGCGKKKSKDVASAPPGAPGGPASPGVPSPPGGAQRPGAPGAGAMPGSPPGPPGAPGAPGGTASGSPTPPPGPGAMPGAMPGAAPGVAEAPEAGTAPAGGAATSDPKALEAGIKLNNEGHPQAALGVWRTALAASPRDPVLSLHVSNVEKELRMVADAEAKARAQAIQQEKIWAELLKELRPEREATQAAATRGIGNAGIGSEGRVGRE